MDKEKLRRQRLVWQKRYRERHPEKCRRAAKACAERYRAKNPERYRAIVSAAWHRRRARERGVAGPLDPAAIGRFEDRVRTGDKVRCYWCSKSMPKGKRTIDHIIPLIGGGAHDVNNLCACCPACNSSKRDKLPEVFSGQYHFEFTPVRREISISHVRTPRMWAAEKLLEQRRGKMPERVEADLKLLAQGVAPRDLKIAQRLLPVGLAVLV